MVTTALRRCLTLLLAVGVTKAPPGAGAASSVDLAIPNFSVVRDGIWRGGRPTPNDVRALQQLGVRTIVNLQGRDYLRGLRPAIELYQAGERKESILNERMLAESLGVTFLNIPFNSLKPVSDEDAARIREAVEVIADPKNHPVFIHCEHGRDRTGLIVAFERVFKENWHPRDAYGEWMRLGHIGWLNEKFTGNLDIYFIDALKASGRLNDGDALVLKAMRAVAAPKIPRTVRAHSN